MIFFDTNIYVYAFFKPGDKKLTAKIKWMKNQAKKIIKKIDDEEIKVCISLLQLSELVNIFKQKMNWIKLKGFLWNIVSNNSIEIVEISKLLYFNAIDKITEMFMDSNDITSYLIIKNRKINQIFTFDKHFRKLEDIECLPIIPEKFN